KFAGWVNQSRRDWISSHRARSNSRGGISCGDWIAILDAADNSGERWVERAIVDGDCVIAKLVGGINQCSNDGICPYRAGWISRAAYGSSNRIAILDTDNCYAECRIR